jgi:hypothetical protein
MSDYVYFYLFQVYIWNYAIDSLHYSKMIEWQENDEEVKRSGLSCQESKRKKCGKTAEIGDI